MKTCSIDGCEKESRTRGWCNMHYQRWWKHGDPLAGNTKYTDPEEAFLARTEPIVGEPAHIFWTGATDGHGYGQLRINGRTVPAHRYAWERQHGPIPDGMVIDHRCWESSCVNVDHLRVCTQAENTRNLSGVRKNDGGLPRGVSRRGHRYRAAVGHNGKRHNLGTFDTIAEASAAASEARRIHFGIYAGNN